MNDEQFQMIALTLKKVVESDEIKLGWGKQQRLAMIEQIKSDKEPTGYRADWLHETYQTIIEVLISKSEQFNLRYRHDMISVNDMLDALRMAMGELEHAALKETGQSA